MKNRYNFLIVLLFLVMVSLGCMSGDEPQNSVSNVNVETTPTPEHTVAEEGGGKVEFGDPAALVADLYKSHDTQKGPFGQNVRARVDKYFAKPFADLIYLDNTKPVDETGALGADPLYDGQDIQIKNFNVGKAAVNGEKATVPVTFENLGQKKKVTVSLVLVSNTWKISDIKYETAGSLYKILKDAYTKPQGNNAPPVKNVKGEFEGTFNVGATTCTVTPAKMAFDVRWAKGKGKEMFFFKDGNTFESEPDDKGGRNEFRFDDDTYSTGVFVRADGKTMPVSRK